ncbi:MAG: hypothetical protein JW703_05200 [Candidatus Diapherotrites archaeon]|nr:hypothetical protein [Candidatus Diapherotrites archaeon]
MSEHELIYLDRILCNLEKVHEQVHSFLQLRKQLKTESSKAHFLERLNESHKKSREALEKFKDSKELNELLKKHKLNYKKAMNLFQEFESEQKARTYFEKKYQKTIIKK